MEFRLYWLSVSSGTEQFYLSIILSFRQSALYSFIHPSNIVPLRHSLASLAWQVNLHSIKSILLAVHASPFYPM